MMDSRTSPQGAEFIMMDSLNMPMTYYKMLSQLRKGDSLVVRVLTDSAFKSSPQGIPEMFKKGHYLITTAKVEEIFVDRDKADSARKAAVEVAAAAQKVRDAEQLVKDDKALQEHLTKNKITTVKTPGGVYAVSYTHLRTPKVNVMLKRAIKTVRQSVMLSWPMEKQIEIIMATDATFTASRNAEKRVELRIFFTSGFSTATKINDGRKIPMVETIAPVQPFI